MYRQRNAQDLGVNAPGLPHIYNSQRGRSNLPPKHPRSNSNQAAAYLVMNNNAGNGVSRQYGNHRVYSRDGGAVAADNGRPFRNVYNQIVQAPVPVSGLHRIESQK